MAENRALVVNIDRCIGCYACEVACKQEHGLPEGVKGISVHTLGPYELDGELAMDFLPLATDRCDLCQNRAGGSKRSACAEVCPTQALSLWRSDRVLHLLRSGSRTQVCKMGH